MPTFGTSSNHQDDIAIWLGSKLLDVALARSVMKTMSMTTTSDDLQAKCVSVIDNRQHLRRICHALSQTSGLQEQIDDDKDSLYLLLGKQLMKDGNQPWGEILNTIQKALEQAGISNAVDAEANQDLGVASREVRQEGDTSHSRNYITLLKERGDVELATPQYEETCKQENPPVWEATATYSGIRAKATGKSKKEAKHLAAKRVWLQLEGRSS